MQQKQKKKTALRFFLFAVPASFLFLILLIPIFVAVIIGGGKEEEKEEGFDVDIFASKVYEENVELYRSEVARACAEFDNEPCQKQCGSLSNYVNLALAIMTEESHGRGLDPMQASLCGYNTKYPRSPVEGQGITDPFYSIDCGVQYMRDAIITAKVTSPTDYGRIGVAIQGYNYGVQNWCKWIAKHGGEYTVSLALQYKNECMNGKGTETHGQKVLDTYQKALKKAPETDIVVNTQNVDEIIKLTEAQAWKLVIGSDYKSKPPVSQYSELQKVMPSKMTTISIKVWWWKGSTGYKKETKTTTLTINKNLETFWKSFFDDVYKHESKIIINPSTLYGYNYRLNNPNQTSISAHSFGVAVDINPEIKGNGYGETPYTKKEYEKLKDSRTKRSTIYVDCPLVQIAKKYSLSWGGEWNSSKDGMHFSFCGDTTR